MNFEESYQKYLILAEANGTTDKLSTNKGRYAVKFNLSQNKIMEWLQESNSTDENRYIQSLKVPYETLSLEGTETDYTSFSIPKNYFEFIDLRVFAGKDKCLNQKFRSREVKGENVSNLLIDSHSVPSFKFRDTFYTIAKDAVQVFKTDFDINSATMSYYRYPVQIELENPDNPESQFKNEQLDFDDKLINRIILATVALHELSSDDPKYQAFKQETIQKF